MKAASSFIVSSLLLIGLVSPPSAAASASPAQLDSAIQRVRGRAARLAKESWKFQDQRRLVEDIEALADDFHALASSGEASSSTAHAFLALVENVRGVYTAALQEMQDEVIRVDGDLEAVQDSRAWQDRELLALRLLYRLNWVRYEIAMRFETGTAKRTRLLEQAAEGFVEFMAGGDSELTAESLYGHGLALKAQRQYRAAADDLRAALDYDPDSEIASRVRFALCDTELSLGNIRTALEQSRLLAAKVPTGEFGAQVMFLRAKVLLLAIGKYRSAFDNGTRGKFRREAARIMEKLHARGTYWQAKVRQLVDAGVEDTVEWAASGASTFVTFLIADSLRRRGQCDEALPLFSVLIERHDYVAESHYGRGLCAFHTGSYLESIAELGSFLELARAKDPDSGQAAWLRFKAAESLWLGDDGSADSETMYLELLRDFLRLSPDHPNAHEAWFRLGEWQLSQHDFIGCAEAFSRVAGDPAFHLKASFQSAQCGYQAVNQEGPGSEAPRPRLVQALAGIDGFLEEAQRFRSLRPAGRATEKLLDPLEARAVVMSADLAARLAAAYTSDESQPSGGVMARLEGFEDRYPDQTELFAAVLAMRINWYRQAGQLDAAGDDVDRLIALEDGGQRSKFKKLGVAFLKEAASRDDSGDPQGAVRCRRIALRLYESLLESIAEDDRARDGLEKLVVDLRGQSRE
ncbi:MAG: tetratricopeptide repeat protein [Candidatus Binatia bacterium]